MKPRVLLWSSSLVLVASGALAAQQPAVTPLPFTGPIPALSPDSQARARVTCTLVYSNYAGPATGYYAAGAGKEVIDDLQLVDTGVLCGFSFTYFNASGGPTDATVTFYANDGPGGAPGTVAAGPFFYPGIPGAGADFAAVVPEVVATIGPDIWMGVSFSAPATGLTFTDPPSIGSSADVYYQRPEEGFFNFGGSPVANFRLSVEVDTPTPVKTSTWGALKTIYRN